MGFPARGLLSSTDREYDRRAPRPLGVRQVDRRDQETRGDGKRHGSNTGNPRDPAYREGSFGKSLTIYPVLRPEEVIPYLNSDMLDYMGWRMNYGETDQTTFKWTVVPCRNVDFTLSPTQFWRKSIAGNDVRWEKDD